jgi:uncharacterized membrane protein YdjX (TVP38/TMEM64 family)
MVILKIIVTVICILLWYIVIGGLVFYLIDRNANDILAETIEWNRERDPKVQKLSDDEMLVVTALGIVAIWPAIVFAYARGFLRGFFASCYRSLIDIFFQERSKQ